MVLSEGVLLWGMQTDCRRLFRAISHEGLQCGYEGFCLVLLWLWACDCCVWGRHWFCVVTLGAFVCVSSNLLSLCERPPHGDCPFASRS